MKNNKKISGIVYKAICPSNNVYIGITITPLNERKRNHLRAVKNGSKLPFHNAIRKYTMKNIKWEILATSDSWEKLCVLERKFIEEYDSYNNGYNLTKGGEGTYGLKHTEEWCDRNIKTRKNFFNNPKNREMQSLANKKAHRSNPKQATDHSEFMKKLYKTESAREKTAEGMRNFLANPENREIHSKQRGAKPFNVFKNNVFVGEWLAQRDCARDLNLNYSHITIV